MLQLRPTVKPTNLYSATSSVLQEICLCKCVSKFFNRQFPINSGSHMLCSAYLYFFKKIYQDLSGFSSLQYIHQMSPLLLKKFLIFETLEYEQFACQIACRSLFLVDIYTNIFRQIAFEGVFFQVLNHLNFLCSTCFQNKQPEAGFGLWKGRPVHMFQNKCVGDPNLELR